MKNETCSLFNLVIEIIAVIELYEFSKSGLDVIIDFLFIAREEDKYIGFMYHNIINIVYFHEILSLRKQYFLYYLYK